MVEPSDAACAHSRIRLSGIWRRSSRWGSQKSVTSGVAGVSVSETGIRYFANKGRRDRRLKGDSWERLMTEGLRRGQRVDVGRGFM